MLPLPHEGVHVTPGWANGGRKIIKVPPICLGMVLEMVSLANHKVQITDTMVGSQRLVRRVFESIYFEEMQSYFFVVQNAVEEATSRQIRDVNE